MTGLVIGRYLSVSVNSRSQSGHWTETALLKVHNDILLSMDKQRVTLLVTLLVLLDQSQSPMNDFPVIRHLVMRTGLWDRQGANIASRYKEMYGAEVFLR